MASGVAGTLTPSSLSVNVVNQGGNKLDQYLPWRCTSPPGPTGPTRRVTMTTTLANRTPDGQSQFIAGPYPGLPLGLRRLLAAWSPTTCRPPPGGSR